MLTSGPIFIFAIQGRAKPNRLRLGRHRLHKFSRSISNAQNPAARRTNLTLIDENSGETAVDGRLEISVGKKNVGRLAAQLERDALQSVGCCLNDRLPHRSASGKRDLIHVGMLYERRPPAVSPKPVMMFTTPGGKPASAK